MIFVFLREKLKTVHTSLLVRRQRRVRISVRPLATCTISAQPSHQKVSGRCSDRTIQIITPMSTACLTTMSRSILYLPIPSTRLIRVLFLTSCAFGAVNKRYLSPRTHSRSIPVSGNAFLRVNERAAQTSNGVLDSTNHTSFSRSSCFHQESRASTSGISITLTKPTSTDDSLHETLLVCLFAGVHSEDP